jgi:NIPSNAP
MKTEAFRFAATSIVGVAAALSVALLSGAAVTPEDARGIFEIRVYTIKSGSMDAFVAWMNTVTKWQESVGMQIVGQFAATEQNRYVWIRKYPDEATRKKLFGAVYGSGGMRQFGAPPGFEGSDVFLTNATTLSKMQFDASAPKPMPVPAAGADGPVIYEFRIYDIKPGTLDSFATFMGERMVPWQERTYQARVLGQFAPYAKVAGSAGGGTVTPEDKTYIWVRVFPNEATRLEQYKMYQDERFRQVGSPAAAGFEKARIIIRANPTSFSKLQ